MRKILSAAPAAIAATLFMGGTIAFAGKEDYRPKPIPDPVPFAEMEQINGIYQAPFCTGSDAGVWVKVGELAKAFEHKYPKVKLVPRKDCGGSRGAFIAMAKGTAVGGIVSFDDLALAFDEEARILNHAFLTAPMNPEFLLAVTKRSNGDETLWDNARKKTKLGLPGATSGTVSTMRFLAERRSAFAKPAPSFNVSAQTVVSDLTAPVGAMDVVVTFSGLDGALVEAMASAPNQLRLMDCGNKNCYKVKNASDDLVYNPVEITECEPVVGPLVNTTNRMDTIKVPFALSQAVIDRRMPADALADLQGLLKEISPFMVGYGMPMTPAKCENLLDG